MLIGPASESERYARQWDVVHASTATSQIHMLVRSDRTPDPVPPGWETGPVTLEELALAYIQSPGAVGLRGPARGWDTDRSDVTR
jgi:hypothetical protein